jgi:hypothetical protein
MTMDIQQTIFVLLLHYLHGVNICMVVVQYIINLANEFAFALVKAYLEEPLMWRAPRQPVGFYIP